MRDTLKRIGLFGGTFDPIHLGHLILARDAVELLKLDQLLFLPARISPYKKESPPAVSAEDRLAMLRLAIEGESSFSIDDRELLRKGPSYAIETVRELQQEQPSSEFIYLIGEDHLSSLSSWKESEELQKKINFAFFARASHLASSASLLSRRIDISSTEIRERLARGASVRYLLPTPVIHYLEKKYLYRSHT